MDLIYTGFSLVLDFWVLVAIFGGVVIGIIFGALPGLSTSAAVILCLPLTFSLTPLQGIGMMMGIYIGGTSGALISAILINIPGTPGAMATTFDGHPMARNGEAGKALGTGIVSSFFGGLISMLGLLFIAPTLASITMKFTPIEYFACTLLSLTIIAGLSGTSMIRGLASGVLGMSIAMVGTAPIDLTQRFTFGYYQLGGGFTMAAVLTGAFAIPEVFALYKEKEKENHFTVQEYKIRGFGFGLAEGMRQIPNMLVSAVMGSIIGILPGLGASTSSPLAYMISKSWSKYPEKYGTGIMDGVVATETANNAVIGGALTTLLTLGIPGDLVTSLIMGAMMIYGLEPGPMLFTSHADLLYSIFASLMIANVFMIIVEFGGIRVFVRLLGLKRYYLFPVIVILCSIGAYSANNRVFDIVCLMVFGMMGYIMKLGALPFPPLIIGFVLGPMFETNLRRGLMITDGDFWAFFDRPIFVGLLIATVVLTWGTIKMNNRVNAAIKKVAAELEK